MKPNAIVNGINAKPVTPTSMTLAIQYLQATISPYGCGCYFIAFYKGIRGRGTLEKEKPPIFGMIQRGDEVVIRMLEAVQTIMIEPLIKATIASGSLVYTDEYGIYNALYTWGYGHKTVCHGAGEYARDEDGDGFCEAQVNTMEGFWSLLRS
jgi:transposase